MSDEQSNPFPVTDLAASAIQIHELYTEFVNAGFTELQAFALVQTYIAAAFRAQGGE